MLEGADIIAMYLDPATTAPISMLELGLFARTGKLIVACPEGFPKKANVQYVCGKFGIEMLESVGELGRVLQTRVEKMTKGDVGGREETDSGDMDGI